MQSAQRATDNLPNVAVKVGNEQKKPVVVSRFIRAPIFGIYSFWRKAFQTSRKNSPGGALD